MNVSVVVPVYNLADCVEETLESVVRAANALLASGRSAKVECICVDDGSTDASPELLDAFAASRLERGSGLSFRVIHHVNGGEGRARNAGLGVASGDWIAFLDGDDVWSEQMLVRAAEEMDSHPEADVIAFRLVKFDSGGQPAFDDTDKACAVDDVRAELPSGVLLEVGIAPTFFRTRCVSGLMFEPLPLGADRLYVANALCRAHSVVRSQSCLYGYRMRQSSMAHAPWSGRKIASQCEYAVGSLRALAGSGKALGAEGCSYLASLWLSDVPCRLRRLAKGDERDAALDQWLATLSDASLLRSLPRHDIARRALLRLRSSRYWVLAFAWAMRKLGLT